MTQLLQQAFNQISQLPIEMQNEIATKLLNDIEKPMQTNKLYQAFEKAGLIGCIDTDEQLSTTYKQKLDFSNKHMITVYVRIHKFTLPDYFNSITSGRRFLALLTKARSKV